MPNSHVAGQIAAREERTATGVAAARHLGVTRRRPGTPE